MGRLPSSDVLVSCREYALKKEKVMQITYAGTLAGTGAAITVDIGFRPRYVKVWNVAAGGLCTLEWTQTMPDAYGFKEVTAGTKSYITSLGITPLANGFTLGADTDVNVSGETVHFVAFE